MTTIVTVHGTFARAVATVYAAATAGTETPPPPEAWWHKESAFAELLRDLSEDSDNPVEIKPFLWSGANSECERRLAGEALLRRLLELEARGEDYSVIAHSHGGSVVSWALMEAIKRKKSLEGLRKWVTVGTPFVELRRERFLFLRLPILLKAIFVASLMLLFMYLFFAIQDIIENGPGFDSRYRALRYVISAVLAALPFIVFFMFARVWDGWQLHFYRKKTIRRARKRFGSKWIGLCHEDDEAVQGLASLRTMSVPIFDRRFLVPAASLASVFILPLVYLYVVLSPTTMVALTELLKKNLYDISEYQVIETTFLTSRNELRTIRRMMQRAENRIEQAELNSNPAARLEAEAELRKLRVRRAALREDLKTAYPNYYGLQRAARFADRFLRRDDRPCPGNTLCDRGHNLALNSRLLFHLVTDEASSWLVDEDVRWSALGRFLRFVVPVLLVPALFGLTAMALVGLMQWIAARLSARVSRGLDRMTWKQIRRSALGNDTESEVALSAVQKPVWLADCQDPGLPRQLQRILTEHSDKAMSESLGKIRGAISDLAFADGSRRSDIAASVIGYLNWKELIHTTYFEVPEFRAFVAHLIAGEHPGLQPRAVERHLSGTTAAQWIEELAPRTPPASKPAGISGTVETVPPPLPDNADPTPPAPAKTSMSL